jgi:hypothetical protein
MVTFPNVRSGSRSPSPSGVTGGATVRQRAGNYAGHAAAVAEATASGFSIASVKVASQFVPLAKGAGGAWVAAAGLSELDNLSGQHDKVALGSNVANAAAGSLQLGVALSPPESQSSFGYASAAMWGVTALTNIGLAIAGRGRNTASRLAQGASGVLNLGAAALSAAAVAEAARGDSTKSANLGLASGVLWAGGAVFQGVAKYQAVQRQASAVFSPWSDA